MVSKWKVLIFTVLGIILSWYIAVLSHEYSHATMAWHFGYKSSPLDIYIANWYLLPVSEAVDYASIMAAGHGTRAALIGVSGISVTILLFLISLFFLQKKYIQKNIFLLNFFFWLADLNLMDIFSYIPNRTLIPGDVSEFTQGLGISPLWIFIPGTILVCIALYRFYKYEVPKMFRLLPIKSLTSRRIYLSLTFWPLILSIVYWEPPIMWPLLSNIANVVSLLLVILIVVVCPE